MLTQNLRSRYISSHCPRTIAGDLNGESPNCRAMRGEYLRVFFFYKVYQEVMRGLLVYSLES